MRRIPVLALACLAACSRGPEGAAPADASAPPLAVDVQAASDSLLPSGSASVDPIPAPPPAGWQEEPQLEGVEYVGRVPADGSGLFVEGWRNDGGFYISDGLHSVSVYSRPDRIAVSAERFRHREADGVAAWTIADAWSFPAVQGETGPGLLCGYGPDRSAWSSGNRRHVVGIVEWSAVPAGVEIHHEGVIAAAEADLVSGVIRPVSADEIYCHQELL